MTDRPVLVIEVQKLVDYLLDVSHPVGGTKARFFVRQGFERSDPETFANALADHAITTWPGLVTPRPVALRHQIEGLLTTPGGSVPNVRSIWEHRPNASEVRLISAFGVGDR